MGKTFHLSVSLDRALEFLKEGKNLFSPTPVDGVRIAIGERMSMGKEYITGCGNENEQGMCAGHDKKIL